MLRPMTDLTAAATVAAPPRRVSLADLALSPTTSRFEGREHGASVSSFVSRSLPGGGADPHVHPYDETFLVLEGRVTFTVDGTAIACGPGDVLVVAAGSVHGFVNAGDAPLLQVSIHACDHVVQEDRG